MKLSYWSAKCLNDSPAYNIRAKTKKEATAKRKSYGGDGSYGPVVKVAIEYRDAFDLMECCCGEGGNWQEESAIDAAGGA